MVSGGEGMNYCKHGKRLLSQPLRKCPDCDHEDEIQELEQQIQLMKACLEFYADENNWDFILIGESDDIHTWETFAEKDKGEKARICLRRINED